MCFFLVFHWYFGFYWAGCSVEADRRGREREKAMGVTCNRCHKPESNRGRLGEVLFRQGSPLMSHLGNPAGQLVWARTGREPLHFQRPQGHKTIVYRITKQIRSERALWLCPRIPVWNCFFLTGYFYFSCAQFHNADFSYSSIQSAMLCCAVTWRGAVSSSHQRTRAAKWKFHVV